MKSADKTMQELMSPPASPRAAPRDAVSAGGAEQHGSRETVSIIVPMLNEAALLPDLLAHLQHWRRQGCEVLLVDGGSNDGSAQVAHAIGFDVIRAPRGRALQMNAGGRAASGSILVFLHADTRLPSNALTAIAKALRTSRWGRFDVHIPGEPLMLRVIASLMNIRSRLTGIATGDQAMFMTRSIFAAVNGFPHQLLMEDIELSRRLLSIERPACLAARVTTSGRRWLQRGVWPTIWLMHKLRWQYWRGVPAEELARRYY